MSSKATRPRPIRQHRGRAAHCSADPVIGGSCRRTNRVGTYGQFGARRCRSACRHRLARLRPRRLSHRRPHRRLQPQRRPSLPVHARPAGAGAEGPDRQVAGAGCRAPAYNWTGFYVGGHFGALYGDDGLDVRSGLSRPSIRRFGGPMAGGQIGYDYQFGKWVVGLEGMAPGPTPTARAACPNGFFFNCEVEMKLARRPARRRLGYALFDRSLVYVKGGVAAAEIEVAHALQHRRAAVHRTRVLSVASTGCPSADRDTDTSVGYTVGFGSEFALTKNWTVQGRDQLLRPRHDPLITSGGQTISVARSPRPSAAARSMSGTAASMRWSA